MAKAYISARALFLPIPIISGCLLQQQSMSQSHGIQKLLDAEREAHQIVADSRAYRAQKLKAAKKDASAEIEAYKAEKDAELSRYKEEHAGSNIQAEKDSEVAVQSELQEILKKAAESKAKVIELLIKSVTTPDPKIHQNA